MLENGYGMMPNAVLFDPDLTSTAKLIYVYVSSLCAERGYCWASNSHIADKFGVSERQVSRCITLLEKYLQIENGSNEKRRIWLDKNVQVPRQKCRTSYDKNVQHNKTNKNTTNRISIEALEISKVLLKAVYENYAWMMPETEDKQQQELERCAQSIDRINRIDGFDWNVIEYVARWSVNDEFWRQNIRSGEKLRKQFKQLMIRIKEEQGKTKVGVV